MQECKNTALFFWQVCLLPKRNLKEIKYCESKIDRDEISRKKKQSIDQFEILKVSKNDLISHPYGLIILFLLYYDLLTIKSFSRLERLAICILVQPHMFLFKNILYPPRVVPPRKNSNPHCSTNIITRPAPQSPRPITIPNCYC